jgi:hypothetical protein
MIKQLIFLIAITFVFGRIFQDQQQSCPQMNSNCLAWKAGLLTIFEAKGAKTNIYQNLGDNEESDLRQKAINWFRQHYNIQIQGAGTGTGTGALGTGTAQGTGTALPQQGTGTAQGTGTEQQNHNLMCVRVVSNQPYFVHAAYSPELPRCFIPSSNIKVRQTMCTVYGKGFQYNEAAAGTGTAQGTGTAVPQQAQGTGTAPVLQQGDQLLVYGYLDFIGNGGEQGSGSAPVQGTGTAIGTGTGPVQGTGTAPVQGTGTAVPQQAQGTGTAGPSGQIIPRIEFFNRKPILFNEKLMAIELILKSQAWGDGLGLGALSIDDTQDVITMRLFHSFPKYLTTQQGQGTGTAMGTGTAPVQGTGTALPQQSDVPTSTGLSQKCVIIST